MGSISVLRGTDIRDRDHEGNDFHHSGTGVMRGQGEGIVIGATLVKAASGNDHHCLCLLLCLSLKKINLEPLYFPC